MATDPDAPLSPPSRAALLGVPLVAGACAAAVWATDANTALFTAVNDGGRALPDAFWANLTVLGEGAAILALAAPMLRRRPTLAFTLLLGALITTLAVHGFKDLLAVPRPGRVLGGDAIHVIGPPLARRSFPSGHATSAFAGAMLVWGLWRGAAPRALALALAALVAVSRLAVGAHWPLDVLAGAALGWLCCGAALHLLTRWRPAPTSAWQLVAAALPPLAGARLLVAPEDDASLTPAHVILAAVGLGTGLAAWIALWKWRRALRSP